MQVVEQFRLSAPRFDALTDRYGSELYGTPDGSTIVDIFGTLLGVLLGIVGVILLGFIIVAGFYWLTAGGQPAQIEKAKNMIVNAVIGLILILSALAIAQFIQASIIDRFTGPELGDDGDGIPPPPG